MDKPVRVRYAPSPTGYPHVGNIRTALFNWLYARHTGGKFIVRIEDTDVARTVPGAVEAILEGLNWLGLDWDEGPGKEGGYGPYFQSHRLEKYKEAADRLVAQGNAYPCYCSSERLEAMRAEQQRLHQPPGYDKRCRNLTPEQRAAEAAKGITPVIRFKIPLEGATKFNDIIRGEVSFENKTLDDFVLLKSDGYPTYHLANIVDDHAMEISHVMRAEEWLPSTPRHVLLYKALEYTPPLFAHMPMILGPDRSKLSKRHGAVSILEYRDEGYLPETMFNFLSLLGWSLDDKTEIMTREQIVENFSIERISQTAAIFNKEKLDWMNGMYIRNLSIDDLANRAIPFLEKMLLPDIPRPVDKRYVSAIIPLIQERAKKLSEIPELTDFFFTAELKYETALLTGKSVDKEKAVRALSASVEKLEILPEFTNENLETTLRPLAEALGMKPGELFSTLRTAVTGKIATPPLFQTMAVLGKERCLKRIKLALEKLA